MFTQYCTVEYDYYFFKKQTKLSIYSGETFTVSMGAAAAKSLVHAFINVAWTIVILCSTVPQSFCFGV